MSPEGTIGRPSTKFIRQAAIRVTNEKVPQTISRIAQLPDPTPEEIQEMQETLGCITAYLAEQGIPAVIVPKHPDLFQNGARRAIGMGEHTRLFDEKTTSRPRYTQGMIDGYRKGFEDARRTENTKEMLEHFAASDNEMEILLEYLENKME
ncbi:hypothetical protein GGI07_005532 [Coemansia sp. Benny D115]|nr:hypothetical protein GGI07_005532 [Coemansia sp. Benny D115]